LLKRERDYCPMRVGDTSHFFKSFLEEDLVHRIVETYKGDPKRLSLAGDSYSGLFCINVLFSKDRLFRSFIIGSPSLYWDDRFAFNWEEAYSKSSDQLEARVYLGGGLLEAASEPCHASMLSNLTRMEEVVRSRGYQGLDLITNYFPNETHLSVIPSLLTRGLRVLFPYKDPKL